MTGDFPTFPWGLPTCPHSVVYGPINRPEEPKDDTIARLLEQNAQLLILVGNLQKELMQRPATVTFAPEDTKGR